MILRLSTPSGSSTASICFLSSRIPHENLKKSSALHTVPLAFVQILRHMFVDIGNNREERLPGLDHAVSFASWQHWIPHVMPSLASGMAHDDGKHLSSSQISLSSARSSCCLCLLVSLTVSSVRFIISKACVSISL